MESHVQFGAAYYPEHRPERCWASDCRLMQDAHVNALRVGEFAWSRFEPQAGAHDWSWLDRFLDTAAAHDIRVLLCTPLRTPPQWLVEQEPGILMETADGIRQTFGGRYRYCINNPALKQRATALYAAMGERYGHDPRVCGWHLDNEHGSEPDCHCPVCTRLFRDWCRREYGSIERLQEAWGLAFWGLHFCSFDTIPTPRGGHGGTGPGHGIAWRRFRSDCTVHSVRWQARTLRNHSDKPITTNNQPLWNFRTDYYQMAAHLDQCGTNYYPPLSGDTGAIALGLSAVRGYRGPGETFQVHELRNAPHMIPGRGQPENRWRPGAVERLAMHVVGNGADALYFFRWDACPFGQEQNHGTIQGYDGKPRRVYREVQRIGQALKRFGSRIHGSTVPAETAIFYDFPTRWDVERPQPFTGGHGLYLEVCKKIFRVLRERAYCVDVCSRHTDWSAYKVIIVPQLSCCDDALADKVLDFVKRGGRLVWHPLCGMKDRNGIIFPSRVHPKLTRLIGCNIQEYEPADDQDLEFRWREKVYTGGAFADLPRGVSEDEKRATYVNDWFAGAAAVIERDVGRGKLHYCTCFADAAFYSDWLPGILEASGVERILPEALPVEVEVCERRADDGTRFVFLLNQSDTAQEVRVPPGRDLYNRETVEGPTALPARGVRVIGYPAQ